MKKTTIVILLFIICSCNKRKDLSLTIINNEFVMSSNESSRDSLNVIRYKLVNNSKSIYYINSLISFNIHQGIMSNDCLNRVLKITDSHNNEVKYDFISLDKTSQFNSCDSLYQSILNKKIKSLGYGENLSVYYNLLEKNNFFIYPNETIYFEYLNVINFKRNIRLSGDNLSKTQVNNSYFAKMYLFSDSLRYKKQLPKNILRTIEENKVKIYHGIIESENIVPIKITK